MDQNKSSQAFNGTAASGAAIVTIPAKLRRYTLKELLRGTSPKNMATMNRQTAHARQGKAAHCRTYFIDLSYSERRPEDPDEVVRDIGEACDSILRYASNPD